MTILSDALQAHRQAQQAALAERRKLHVLHRAVEWQHDAVSAAEEAATEARDYLMGIIDELATNAVDADEVTTGSTLTVSVVGDVITIGRTKTV